MTLKKKLLILPPVAIGLAVLIVLVRSNRGPERETEVERARPVRVVSIELRSVIPTATAYGTIVPGRTWLAVAEVSGQVKSIAPHLKAGKMFPANTELLSISSTVILGCSKRALEEVSVIIFCSF